MTNLALEVATDAKKYTMKLGQNYPISINSRAGNFDRVS